LARAEGYTELVGDVLLACTGGTPTAAGQPVPQITIQIFLSQNVTSKITGVTGSSSTGTSVFLEALLIIDEPNSSLHPGTPLLNCGYSNALAPDTSLSGPGVCSINGTSGAASLDFVGTTGNTSITYNGTAGHPNVFQGRQALSGNNSVVFQGVPFDPPGTLTRYLRFTNVRVNANGAGIAQANQTSVVTMGIASSGNNVLQLSIASQAVATVLKGLNSSTVYANATFAQCISQVKNLITASPAPPFGSTSTCGSNSCDGPTNNSFTSGYSNPTIRFSEGFASSWKVKNVAFTVQALGGNMVYTGGGGNDSYSYSTATSTNPINYPTDVDQNVPGVAYNSESGFVFNPTDTVPAPNPPLGFQTSVATTTGSTYPFANGATISGNSTGNTGFSNVGIATQGSRLAAALANVPNGLTVFVAPVLYLYRQGTQYTNGPNTNNGLATGVMVLTNTASDGSGVYNPPSGLAASTVVPPGNQPLQPLTVTNGSALVVYEILATDVYTLEYVDVPFVVSYASALSTNAPIGLPQPNVIATYAAGFAPFYSTSAATLASSSLPVPRFVFTGAATNLFGIVKCSCNLLFPYVTQAPGYDTGIAIANTTADPYGTTNQFGSVQMWYYGTLTNGGAAPGTQCTNTASPGTCPGTTTVGAGQVLTYTLYNGSAQWGLDNRGAGFTGYMIAQAQFQYCHAFAFIGGLGGGPAVNSSTNGLSEGYLALVLDLAGLPRTNIVGESLGN